MKTAALLVLALAVPAAASAQTKVTDKAFVSGGKLDLHLEAGDYEVKASRDNHVRVTLSGDMGNTVADVVINGTHADVNVHNTPNHSNNFHVAIEIPKISDVAIRLSAGDLDVDEITGSKDIETRAGDVKIAVGSPDNYSSVDASVSIGDVSTGPFPGAKGGLLSHGVKWTGKGKYTLRAHLMVGDLKLR